jgi:hypothetical protein
MYKIIRQAALWVVLALMVVAAMGSARLACTAWSKMRAQKLAEPGPTGFWCYSCGEAATHYERVMYYASHAQQAAGKGAWVTVWLCNGHRPPKKVSYYFASELARQQGDRRGLVARTNWMMAIWGAVGIALFLLTWCGFLAKTLIRTGDLRDEIAIAAGDGVLLIIAALITVYLFGSMCGKGQSDEATRAIVFVCIAPLAIAIIIKSWHSFLENH